MKDRPVTDYEWDKHFTCNIPDWVYFVIAAPVLIIAAGFIGAPLVIGVIGIARGVW